MPTQGRDPASPQSSERGQVIVVFALFLVALLAMAGLLIDGGMAWVNREQAQSAADTSALAGAEALRDGTDIRSAALSIAAANGFDPADPARCNGQGTSVTINHPPTSGPNRGNSDAVEIITTRPMRTSFANVVGQSCWMVSARAVASIHATAAPYSMLILGQETEDGILRQNVCESVEIGGGDHHGDSHLTTAGGLMVNSNCSTGKDGAVAVDGHPTVSTQWTHVVGTWTGYPGPPPGSWAPQPQQVPAPLLDPLAGLVGPDPHQAPSSSCPGNGGGTPAEPKPCKIEGPGVFVLSPGVYWGGLRISGRATVYLTPGTYILAGGGLTLNGNASLTSVVSAGNLTPGGGVLLYNTVDPDSPTDNGKMGDIKTAGSAGLNLWPLQQSPYAGLVVWQDRVPAHQGDVEIEGSSTAGIRGTVYVPVSEVEIEGGDDHGGSKATVTGQFIAGTLEVEGNSNLQVNYDANLFYHGQIGLVE